MIKLQIIDFVILRFEIFVTENVRRNFRVVIYCILVKKLEIRGNKEVKKNMKILILEIYKEQNLKIYSSNVKI